MDKSELFKKIEAMNIDELWSYYSAAKGASRFMDVIGVSLILAMMIFYSTLVLIVGSMFVYIVAQVGASMGRTLEFIEERIVDLTDK